MRLISRNEAWALLESHLTQVNLRRHSRAVEAVMRALAVQLGEDEELWGLTGLLHDLDAQITASEPSRHTYLTVEWLNGMLPQESLYAIQSHCGAVEPKGRFDIALRCADPVTGFITACALMHPSRSLKGLDGAFLMKRFKEKRFAAGASREQMAMCSHLGLTVEQFLHLALQTMREISEELGL